MRQIFRDDFLYVSMKKETKIDSSTRMQSADDEQEHWFGVVDAEMPDDDAKSSNDREADIESSCDENENESNRMDDKSRRVAEKPEEIFTSKFVPFWDCENDVDRVSFTRNLTQYFQIAEEETAVKD